MINFQRLIAILVILFCCMTALNAEELTLEGEWVMVPQASTEIDLYGILTVEITCQEDGITLTRTFGGRRSFRESLPLKTGGVVNRIPVLDRVFPTNVFMGLSMDVGSDRLIKAFWIEGNSHLRLEETCEVIASQGKISIRSEHDFLAGPSSDLMTYTIKRSTRKTPISYVLKRKGSREAYFMQLEDEWSIGEGLEKQAFLISLQGNANRKNTIPFARFLPWNKPYRHSRNLLEAMWFGIVTSELRSLLLSPLPVWRMPWWSMNL
jgi:hypothetical protein